MRRPGTGRARRVHGARGGRRRPAEPRARRRRGPWRRPGAPAGPGRVGGHAAGLGHPGARQRGAGPAADRRRRRHAGRRGRRDRRRPRVPAQASSSPTACPSCWPTRRPASPRRSTPAGAAWSTASCRRPSPRWSRTVRGRTASGRRSGRRSAGAATRCPQRCGTRWPPSSPAWPPARRGARPRSTCPPASSRSSRGWGSTAVEATGWCTLTDERFHSHRRSTRTGEPAGRCAAVVAIPDVSGRVAPSW